MLFTSYNRTGKVISFIGIWMFAFGFTFNKRIGIADTPELFTFLSIPAMIIGVVLLIMSNFFKLKKD